MDYIKIPRSLIYKERESLNDFGVNTPGTINNQLFSHMKELPFMYDSGAKDLALLCFNNAYYICTVIMLDEFPGLQIAEYEKKLLEVKIPYSYDVCAASMAMVCELLPVYDAKWKPQNSDLINRIVYRFHHFEWVNLGERKSFDDIVNSCNKDGMSLPRYIFAPRDIYEAVEVVNIEDLAAGVEYVISEINRMYSPRVQVKAADLALARFRDYLREMKEEEAGNPSGFSSGYDTPYNSAIAYIEKHHPSLTENNANNTAQTENTQVVQEDKTPVAAQDTDTAATLRELEEKVAQQTRLIEEKDETIHRLQGLIEDYEAKYDPKDSNKKQFAAMTGKQHVILFLAFLAQANRLPPARKSLSLLMSFIASRNESTMESYLGHAVKEEECETLAKVFEEEKLPYIAELIRALPDKLKKDKSEKNRNKALKNDKM